MSIDGICWWCRCGQIPAAFQGNKAYQWWCWEKSGVQIAAESLPPALEQTDASLAPSDYWTTGRGEWKKWPVFLLSSRLSCCRWCWNEWKRDHVILSQRREWNSNWKTCPWLTLQQLSGGQAMTIHLLTCLHRNINSDLFVKLFASWYCWFPHPSFILLSQYDKSRRASADIFWAGPAWPLAVAKVVVDFFVGCFVACVTLLCILIEMNWFPLVFLSA